ncbi:hypothetical protein GOP47_0010555 [Adiantum capillus-veneris]|uniref:RNA helicase n=1 Tax=Adiantum capillus-veneris TaxID=13818 RepID=A0A9D4UVI9_ADICA|nr:hypothetical protein GOP47_0010555 [Adiantum capillus-veneris]
MQASSIVAGEDMGFGDLGVCDQLVKACLALGWKEPTPIQTEAIPLALAGKDIIGLAQTGSGKTAAFVIPILQVLLEKSHPFFASVLSPTRELAIQIGQQFEAMGSGIGLKCAVVVGGVDVMSEMIALGKGPHIVVGTPGRFAFHLANTKGFNLRSLKFLVLDEADRLLDLDFEKEMDEILKAIPRERQTLLYSATMTSKVAKLQRACLRNPAKVEVSTKLCTVDTLRQEYLFIPFEKKDSCLAFLLHELAGNVTMVFTKTCKATRRLHLVLRCLGLKAVPISGKMTQPKRLAALNKFKSGDRDILICTDVASRGLDIPSVDLVINYDIPVSSKDYVHRVGRTARAGRSGRAISIITQYDLEYFLRIEAAIGKKLPGFKADMDDLDVYQSSVSEAQRLAVRHMHEHDHDDKYAGRRKGFSGYNGETRGDY